MQLSHFNANQLNTFFIALTEVETGGELEPMTAIGSHGELGPFQITHDYFVDSGVEGDYEEVCTTIEGSVKVMLAYWQRYASHKPTLEELARLHNGGPKGPEKESTKSYWDKVNSKMGYINKQQGKLL